EHAIRQLGQTLFPPGNAKNRLHAIVVRGQITIGHWPVFAESVVIPALELVVAQPPRGPSPLERLAPNRPDPDPIIRVVFGVRVRILPLVEPHRRIPLGRLRDMRKSPWTPETAI